MRILVVLALTLSLLGGCGSLPENVGRAESHAFTDTQGTVLGIATAPLVAAHPGQSGAFPMANGVDAFVARLALATIAQRSLDLQYYIWHDDTTGRLLAHAVLAAADRGVRVRVILDDVGTGADDAILLALDAHPNVEIRLFNPVAMRTMRVLGIVTDPFRTNRRMHNKSFTADNQVAVVGGRNVGDEYFAARPDVEFGDLDLAVIGPIVHEVSTAFDLYWASESTYPISSLAKLDSEPAEALAALRAKLAAFTDAERDSPYASKMLHSSMVGRLRSGALEYQWGDARLVFDDPAKIKAARSDRATHLLPQLAPVIEATRAELVLVSPYFVPGDEGVAFLEGLVARGVDVTVLTNSLASNDVLPVYAGYAPYQKRLLAAGVRLWELKPGARPRGREREEATLTEQLKGSASGSSRAALHAKTFVFDRKALFVGSLNLDPRSSTINTEIGALFRNETLAGGIAGTLAGELPGIAYRLELRDGAVRWIERRDGGEIVHDVEPETSFARRAAAKALALLPIEGML